MVTNLPSTNPTHTAEVTSHKFTGIKALAVRYRGGAVGDAERRDAFEMMALGKIGTMAESFNGTAWRRPRCPLLRGEATQVKSWRLAHSSDFYGVLNWKAVQAIEIKLFEINDEDVFVVVKKRR